MADYYNNAFKFSNMDPFIPDFNNNIKEFSFNYITNNYYDSYSNSKANL